MLSTWSDFQLRLKKRKKLDLFEAVFQDDLEANEQFHNFEEYIVYLNYIAIDLLKLIRKKKSNPESLDKSQSGLIKTES